MLLDGIGGQVSLSGEKNMEGSVWNLSNHGFDFGFSRIFTRSDIYVGKN